MPADQLRSTTMDKEKRKFIKINLRVLYMYCNYFFHDCVYIYHSVTDLIFMQE